MSATPGLFEIQRPSRLASPFENLGSHYDAVVVGSGYGASIAASRLARAGQRVCVLERGRGVPAGRVPGHDRRGGGAVPDGQRARPHRLEDRASTTSVRTTTSASSSAAASAAPRSSTRASRSRPSRACSHDRASGRRRCATTPTACETATRGRPRCSGPPPIRERLPAAPEARARSRRRATLCGSGSTGRRSTSTTSPTASITSASTSRPAGCAATASAAATTAPRTR